MQIVYPNLYGRLGNQLCQIMNCIAYSLKHEINFHIPTHTLNNEIWSPVITWLSKPDFNPNLENILIREAEKEYFELPFSPSWKDSNIRLDGYWQQYPYFIDYVPQIRKALGIGKPDMYPIKASIHIRRGDYLLYPDKHPVVTSRYLDSAIDFLRSDLRVHYDDMMISTDDRDWAEHYLFKNGIRIPFATDLMEHIFEYTPLNNWSVMSGCQYHVISNSSYSYTAAILSDTKNKVVISPSSDNWYGENNKHLPVKNLIPPDWIQIKY